MPYYDFDRHYSVKANSPQEAKIKFSRALENDEEDQYYVNTTFGFPQKKKDTGAKKSGLGFRILVISVSILRSFFKGALEQFTYTAPKKPKKYRRY